MIQTYVYALLHYAQHRQGYKRTAFRHLFLQVTGLTQGPTPDPSTPAEGPVRPMALPRKGVERGEREGTRREERPVTPSSRAT